MKGGANKRLKIALAFVFAGAILVSATVFASGVRRTENIDVTYDNIQIVLDGKTIEPKDALGNKVEPFIYNGTTYLPVRAVGEAFGKQVGWDGETKTVYIGAKPGEHESWLVQCPPYSLYRVGTYYADKQTFFKMAGKDYTDAATFQGWGKSGTASYAIFNLDGKYDSFTFTYGHVDTSFNANGKLMIVADDETVFTVDMEWDDVPTEVTVPLKGALQMQIVVYTDDYQAQYGIANAYFE